ncbi:MAG: hypothetical protein SO054_04980, partial [Ruminococcus callidus]|nr:hypothetical protein [Ruminococcus callidus]
MTENLQADCVQSRQAGFIQCFLYVRTRRTVFLFSLHRIQHSAVLEVSVQIFQRDLCDIVQ